MKNFPLMFSHEGKTNKIIGKKRISTYKKLYDYIDYFVINISSPNTPGLRELQTPNFLKDLLQ